MPEVNMNPSQLDKLKEFQASGDYPGACAQVHPVVTHQGYVWRWVGRCATVFWQVVCPNLGLTVPYGEVKKSDPYLGFAAFFIFFDAVRLPFNFFSHEQR